MRKNVVITGVVILFIGIALIAAGIIILEKSAGLSLSEQNVGSGKWVKAPVYVNSSDIVVISAHTTVVYLIPFADYNSSITQSAAKADSILPSTNSSTTGITSLSFTNLSSGEYAAISFSSSDPQLIVVVTNGATLSTALLVVAGGIMFLAGLIVTIYGLLKKNRPPNMIEDIPY